MTFAGCFHNSFLAGLLLEKKTKQRPTQQSPAAENERGKVKTKAVKPSAEKGKAGEQSSSMSISSVMLKERRQNSSVRTPITSAKKRSRSCKFRSVRDWHPPLSEKDPLS